MCGYTYADRPVRTQWRGWDAFEYYEYMDIALERDAAALAPCSDEPEQADGSMVYRNEAIFWALIIIIAAGWAVSFVHVLIHACHVVRRRKEIEFLIARTRKSWPPPEQRDVEKDGDDACCTMCLEPFSTGEDVSTLGCGHSFHSDCIQRWLVTTVFVVRTCPICRQNPLSHVEEEDVQQPRLRGEASTSVDEFGVSRLVGCCPTGLYRPSAIRMGLM